VDIGSIKASDREIELKHPVSEEGLGLFFSIRSPYSDEVKKAQRAWLNERLAKKKQTLTAEALEAAKEKQIMAAVSGWRFEGDANINGEQPAFSPVALRELIREHEWIRQALDEELGDTSGFFEG
jgi:hypothetical protein